MQQRKPHPWAVAAWPRAAGDPPRPPSRLGDPLFRAAHGVRFAYVGGAMANGISSEEMVEAFARAGMLSFFGAAGCSLPRIEAAIDRLQASVGDLPHGFNLIHSPSEPAVEAETVELFLSRGVRAVSASAYLGLTLPLVRYRLTGIHRDSSGRVVVPNRVLAKVSRPEVARRFLEPAPTRFVEQLVETGQLTAEQAELASLVPMAEDITAEADSGGHTDRRPLVVLLPELLALRDEVTAARRYATRPRVGAGGGIATPASAAAAFQMGAAYVVTGSVNQACRESGSSDAVRAMLAQAGPGDVGMAPAADMFEMGVELQVLTRGTMFAPRARRLYELYKAFGSIEELPAADVEQLESKYFRCSLAEAWASTEAWWAERDPTQVERAAAEPKHRLALLFRGYLGQSSRWANGGVADRRLDYQVWTGPSMGAFNAWVDGSPLQAPEARTVVGVAHNVLAGAAVRVRVTALRTSDVELLHGLESWKPRSADEVAELIEAWEAADAEATLEAAAATELVRDVRISRNDDAIAIVGMSCLFPGAPDLASFWRTVRTGADQIRDVPDGYWSPDDYFDEDSGSPDRTYAKRGAFLDPYPFDPTEFGIPPNILEATDTSQLLSLVVARQALIDAGCDPDDDSWDRSRTSVLLGVTGTQELVISLGARLGHPHWFRALRQAGVDDETAGRVVEGIGEAYPSWQESSFPGLLGNVVAGRICNRFDLGGTNAVTDAACASSLAALHLACMELSTGRADRVLTGGVDTLNDIFMHMCFSKTPALSPTGDARPFSADADGTILGEGIGMVVLKRLSDAQRDGDRVYAVMRGVGTASDGRAKSIYAPRPAGQARALRDAYKVAGVSPASVGLVEAHGTGTTAGDLCEFEALDAVFREAGALPGSTALGSVKSQIGHTKAAAGAAGLIKAALALHHKVIPPTLKVSAPSPKLALEGSPIYLSTEARPWLSDGVRRAGVSSFGFGGSDYHVVLEEYEDRRGTPSWDDTVEIVPLSADDPAGLRAALKALRSPLIEAAARARRAFRPTAPHRLVLVVEPDGLDSVVAAALGQLASRPDTSWSLPNGVHYGVGPADGGLGFLFPGQGAQYPGMLAEPTMVFGELLAALQAEPDLAARVHPVPTFDPARRDADRAALTATEVAQPALGAVEAGLLSVLGRFGLRPDATAGHSYGELVALHAAGRMDRPTLRALSTIRGHLMAGDGSDRGTMLAVLAPLADIEALIAERGLDVVLANRNGPQQGVISGARSAIDAAEAACAAAGLRTRRLDVGAAFHSALVADARPTFAEALTDWPAARGGVPVYANATGACYPDDPVECRTLLADQLISPVRFVEQIEAMYDAGVRVFVEVGPRATLTGLVGRILGDRPHLAVAADPSSGRRGLRDLADMLARLAAAGRTVDLTAWQDVPRAAARTPRMVVPLSGANHRPDVPRATAPVRPPTGLPAAPPTREPTMSKPPRPAGPGAAPAPPADPSALGQALSTAHQTLQALAAMQQQTAAIHQQFLAGQQAAQTNLQALIAGQQRLLEAALGGDPSSIPMPVMPLPAMPQPVFAQPAAPIAWATPVAAPAAMPATPVAAPAPAPPAPVAAPTVPLSERLVPTLLTVVSESTGYPPEMLDLDMDMESDLGIDSIKRVEILSLFTERMPEAPQVEPEQLGRLRTLRHVAEMVAEGVAEAAAPAGDPAPAAPAPSTATEIVPTLLAVVSESTGYPPEMLDLDMDMESDLGIDSIKRVEILSLFTERMPDAPQVEPEQLGRLRTLRQVAEFVGGQGASPADAASPAAEAAPQPAPTSADLGRWVVEPMPAGSLMSGAPTLQDAWVVDDGTDLARALAERLNARLVSRGESNGGLPDGPCGALVLMPASADGVLALKEAFGLTRALGLSLREAGGLLVTVSRLDGSFGLGRGDVFDPIQGGLAGLSKTAAHEWPEVCCRAFDVAPEMDVEAAAAAIAGELTVTDGPAEVGLTTGGRRTLVLRAAPAPQPGSALPAGSLVVVTGGARGVTATCAIELARSCGASLLLLGRSPAPADEPAWLVDAETEVDVKRAMLQHGFEGRRPSPRELGEACSRALGDREIRATLAALADVGAAVLYRSVDVRDAAAVAAAVDEARARFGPVRGLVHGAGVLRDRRIEDKTAEQFDVVFDTKVLGLRSLLAAIGDDALRFAIAFTSVSGRFGRRGQIDYAMANEVLAKTLAALPGDGVRRVAIDWGPWEGGMVTPVLKAQFEREGVGLIPLQAGSELLVVEALGAADGPLEVVVGVGLEPMIGDLAPSGSAEELVLDTATHLYLADHQLSGKPVVPMAMMLEWFAAAAARAVPGREVVGVEDLQVLRGLVLEDGPIGAGIVLTPERDGRVHAELHDSDGGVRARASVVLGAREAAPTNRLDSGPFDAYPLTVDEAYSKRLFHGDRFHAIEQLEGISSDGLTAALRSTPDRSVWIPGDTGAWATDPLAVDGCFQSMILWCWEQRGSPCLPNAVRRYRQFRDRWPKSVRANFAVSTSSGANVDFDVDLVDDAGELVARLEGVRCTISSSLVSAFGKEDGAAAVAPPVA